MPFYEYNCDKCGLFSILRPLIESSEPVDCPDCGLAASKVFPIVNLAGMRPENRKAWERNEQSAHQPHVCGSGCSHGPPPKKPKADSEKPVLKSSTKRNRRPWMLGH